MTKNPRVLIAASTPIKIQLALAYYYSPDPMEVFCNPLTPALHEARDWLRHHGLIDVNDKPTPKLSDYVQRLKNVHVTVETKEQVEENLEVQDYDWRAKFRKNASSLVPENVQSGTPVKLRGTGNVPMVVSHTMYGLGVPEKNAVCYYEDDGKIREITLPLSVLRLA